MSDAAARHELLQSLQQLTSPSTSLAEQHRIVRVLYDVDLDVLEDCLLQLCHVCVTHLMPGVQDMLRLFMLWLAGQSLHVALRLSWNVDAVFGFFTFTGLGDRLKDIQDSLETYAINHVATRPSWRGRDDADDNHMTNSNDHFTMPCNDADHLYSLDAVSLSNDASLSHQRFIESLDPTDVIRKEMRLKIYDDERQFVSMLTDISSALRFHHERTQRKKELRRRLQEVNERVHKMLLIHPIGKSSDPVSWIVNIVVDESIAFSSRTRAPFLIRYEVIVDETATMHDPARSTLRHPDGSFFTARDTTVTYCPHHTRNALVSSERTVAPNTVTHDALHNDGNAHSAISAARHLAACGTSPSLLRKVFGESAEERTTRIRRYSVWGSHPSWALQGLLIKAGDDLRQEELALQIVHVFTKTWVSRGLTCTAHPYRVVSTSADCGFMEVVEDAVSIDGIKKACGAASLYQFFMCTFDGESSTAFHRAQQNFVETMAGYSVISYLLQVKDRHNGNLMLSRTGALIHIDFGYLIATSPGGLNFESAPFKLSQELLDIMGGPRGEAFNYYKVLVYQALAAARQCAEDVVALVALMVPYNTMLCLGTDPTTAVTQLRDRFRFDVTQEADFALIIRDLITSSVDNWRTRRYDQFQTLQNGIL